jgi:hypothetical protein
MTTIGTQNAFFYIMQCHTECNDGGKESFPTKLFSYMTTIGTQNAFFSENGFPAFFIGEWLPYMTARGT